MPKRHPFIYFALLLTVGALSRLSADEPRFQALVPGVRITPLPVKLTNIDSLSYGPDGKLYAAGYDGRVHVLTDTDGDGLEDRADLFWDKPGDLLTPVGILATKDGLYVAARGKIALLRDTDGDGRADESRAVVSGWVRETVNSDTRNDAAGIALDAAGNLYFSLGCMSYNKAWMLDKQGRSHYDIGSERGTILKVSPDRKQREIVATGLRFVIGIEFNRHGDMFATDQEGDTWFPGGNPRDELLHIVPGRHYGFPFRHPKYLPKIIDEPSVVGFSPQHQSACGFRFNDDRSGRKRFGPDFWQDNAIVSGFSRGKLWRVPLAKTRAGYVGKQVQFAAFEGLLTDVAISPRGTLVVTSHSGRPDWGAGPAAPGRLYQLSYDRNAPQPVAAWSAGPVEVKIAFDRPLADERFGQAEIEMGDFAWEGDRYEWIYPGYEVVANEKRAPRRQLKVMTTSLSPDRRTVTLTTAPQPWKTRYRVTLKGVAGASPSRVGATVDRRRSSRELAELSFDMTGVQAVWTEQGKTTPTWSGWLPHFDPSVVQVLVGSSSEHERFSRLLSRSGALSLRSRLLLPGEDVELRLESSREFSVSCGKQKTPSRRVDGLHRAILRLKGKREQRGKARGGREQVLPSEMVDLQIEVATGGSGEFVLNGSYRADFDPYDRPLRLEHLFVPWVPALKPSAEEEATSLVGRDVPGDPQRGRELFFGKEANCSSCHTFAGEGGKVAADLTPSMHRDPAAVMRDIVDPSGAINPDYVSYTVLTREGKVFTGLVQSADKESITLIDVDTKTHVIPRRELDVIRPSAVSLMPAGFDKLGKEKLRDLVAFLCTKDAAAKRTGTPSGVVDWEVWPDFRGGDLAALRKLAAFPEQPADRRLLSRFETPVNWNEYYGSRVRGYVHPPQSGKYTFWLAADDQAELWLSRSDRPEEKIRIIRLERWTPSRKWSAYPEQKSAPIRLEAGKKYYIEAVHVEATVDDCLAVGWQLPDGTRERPIPGKRLSRE